MAFEVIVLGGSGTFPAPGAACSGYLLKSATTNLWVDAGPGSFANLQRHIKIGDLTGIVLTHMHLDHIVDIFPFLYATLYGPDKGEPRGIPVYAPAGSAEFIARIAPGDGDLTFGGHLTFHEIARDLIPTVGDMELRFAQTRHPIETYAVRVTCNALAVAYTADTGPSPQVTNFIWGANLLIAEASNQKATKESADLHMSATEAGAMAAQGCVSQLLLTHIVPGLDHKVSHEMAQREFRGEIQTASDNLRIIVF